MTRFGEISPLWQNLKVFGQKLLLTIWPNFEHALAWYVMLFGKVALL